ncbi:hypothetical protein [Cyclobacterium plantarum]|uniref:Transposase n=1 Tax=Cyclobacterium plantarum TaxID=2716263 RepID=A0ABX0H5L2_9BACT|nr:hypothetical protein [Cyclobacterium plantarum]NHE55561.1 hypothetical protein [Cyclobacterium plantarum]
MRTTILASPFSIITGITAYSYTQLMERFNRKYARIRSSMKLDHEPGKEIFIDYAGTKMHIVDRETGEEKPAEVFLATEPYSIQA